MHTIVGLLTLACSVQAYDAPVRKARSWDTLSLEIYSGNDRIVPHMLTPGAPDEGKCYKLAEYTKESFSKMRKAYFQVCLVELYDGVLTCIDQELH